MSNSNPEQAPNPIVHPERYFLGVSTAVRPDWEKYLLEPQATRSTKPESVAKEKAEKREKQAQEAAVTPIAATVTAATVLNQAGEVAFEATQGPERPLGEVSYMLLAFLSQVLGDCLLINAPRMRDTQVRLFGFFIRERLRLIGVDACRYARSTGLALQNPIGLWYHRPFEPPHYLDPYEVFVPTDSRKDVDVAGLCDFLHIQMPPAAELMKPAVQAWLARTLALAGQMFTTGG
jgi:hypothetical protein